ncbi:PAS domain S-box protein [Roseomonas chloroacetimidivorans]|uniref:PAS domain S-box protein n=1 Tax=Roseomonas chloroacetimidivorans TaxID=1766656 RepID=UPI003C76D0E8
MRQSPAITQVADGLFRTAFEYAALPALITEPDLAFPGPRIRFANAAMASMTGFSVEELVGKSPRILQGPRTDRAVLDRLKAGLSRERRFSGEVVNYRKDGSEYMVEWAITALPGADGSVQGWLSIQRDVTERRASGRALVAAEARQRALVEGIPQLVWRAADSGSWTWSSPQWSRYTGLSEEESQGQGWLAALHPDDREAALAAWAGAENGVPLDMETRIFRAAEGRYRWHRTRATPVSDESGRPMEWLGTSTDIDDLRRLQDQQGVLIAELQHRTRNLLGVVRSIAEQTIASNNSVAAFRKEFGERLEALSRVQGFLSRSAQEPITIGALIRAELAALGGEEFWSRITLDGPEVPLRNSMVQILAMALHELATNARKYGALAVMHGRLTVTWRIQEGDGRRLLLQWVERGVGRRAPDRESARRGYGRELIEKALPYQLGASTIYELDENGLRCIISAPVVSLATA